MKLKFLFAATFFILLFSTAMASNKEKPRAVILTDVSTWETDDSESLVRLLSVADMIEIEAIIYTTGWSLDTLRQEFFSLIQNPINAYEKDLKNLMKRSDQKSFKSNENKQKIGYFPSPDYLRSRTMTGSYNRGAEFIGQDNLSDGSNFIIELADEKDNRPLWVLAWGGANTLSQAIWQVQQSRSDEEVNKFLNKIKLFAITDQDIDQGEEIPRTQSSQYNLREKFQDNLFYIWDECAWRKMCGTKENWSAYAEHIQTHGNLGKEYPKYIWGVEGDTPSFLHIIPNGLNNPQRPEQASWAGYSKWQLSLDGKTYCYTNQPTTESYTISSYYFDYFYSAAFNDFAARMDWAAYGKGNRNPTVIVNGKKGIDEVKIKSKAGKTIKLDYSKSYDIDGDSLSYKWWVQGEAGTYTKAIEIENHDNATIYFQTPSDAGGTEIHIIAEVTDNGTPHLTSYRRIIITVN